MNKKIFAFVITIALAVTLIPTTSFAKWQRRFFTKDGMTWDISNGEAELVKVDKDFKGTIPDVITADDNRQYRLRKLIDEIEWDNTSVTTLRLPNSVAYLDGVAFKYARNIERFETYETEPNEEFVYDGKQLLYIDADSNGLLYWMTNEMCEYGPDKFDRTLMAYPKAKKDENLIIEHGTSEIRIDAFYYCTGLDRIKNIIIQDDEMGFDFVYDLGDDALDYIALQNDGSYDFSNLTMVFRDLSIKEGDENYDDIDGGENYITNEGAFKYAYKRGMKIDACINDLRVDDVVYNKNGKYKLNVKYNGHVKLKKGKDYDLKIYENSNPLCLRDIEVFGVKGGPFENQSMITSQFITPKKMNKVKATRRKNSIKVEWKRDKNVYGKCKHVDGYQIGYDKKGYRFHWGYEPRNIVTVKGQNQTKKIIRNVAKPRKYAVAIRSYKIVEDQVVCGPWSNVNYGK